MNDLTSKYPVRGLLQCIQEGSMSTIEVECRINAYMQAIAIKARGEAKLEYINKAYKSHQALCDMLPESDEKVPTSNAKAKGTQSCVSEDRMDRAWL